MSRRILLLFLPLLFAIAIPIHSQSQIDEFVWQDRNPPDPPPHYIANMELSSRFPMTVQLRTDSARLRGGDFVGHGTVHIFNPHGENRSFHYRCGMVFPAYRPAEFYARWITPGRKLEIALREPGTKHTGTCRISTSPPAPVPSGSTVNATANATP